MINRGAVLLVSLLIVFSFAVLAQDDDFERQKEEAIAKAKEMKAEIESECKEDPYTCSCHQIPCEDLLEAEHERKQEAYDRCVQERDACEEQRQDAIKEMEQLKDKISSACEKDLDKCDCSDIKSEDGKKECEKAVRQAKKQAKEERDKMIESCTSDLGRCNCESIQNSDGREECSEKRDEALEFKEKIKKACEKDPGACSCSKVESAEGRKQCEEAKDKAIKEAGKEVTKYLEECFKDVDACDCSSLGLPNKEYVDYCEVQKGYGLACRDEGLYCDELDEMELVPPGLPEFLRPIFKSTYKTLIEKEKSRGAKEAAGIMKECITNPKECDCSKVPTYAVDFCEHKKDLQLKCLADDYAACMELEEEPDLPEGMPKFSVGMFQKIADGARKAQEGIVKSRAAKNVGDMILECMDDSSKCDCSMAPKGEWKAFCEHKKELVNLCREKKHYESCFTLDEEPIITEDMPGFVKSYVNKNVVPEVDKKKQVIFDEMKQGTECQDIATIPECKSVLLG